MAVFERDNAKIVVRVVYDGPGNAGKTTNLTEMCQFFTSRRRSELLSPEARDGRTMWFDWLQIDAGLVAGHGLRCQIVTVPGQVVLRRRRSALLRSADVVVMVCDSTPAGLELVRPAFGRIRQFVAEQAGADVPIVVQANKQDLPGALPPEEIAAALGADASIPIVAARANAGVGVKETLVLAIRAAANRAQQLVLERGLEALSAEPDAAERVLAELRRLDDVHGPGLDELLDRPAFVEDIPVPASPSGAECPEWWPQPPLGGTSIAPGNLWPAASGREVLRRLTGARPRPRLDLVAQLGDRDGSGRTDTVIYDAEGWCLKTAIGRRFDDLDAARVALVKLARTKIALGALTLAHTVLVTAGDPDTGYWVWTFAPWRTTLRAAMSDAVARSSEARLGEALRRFADAVAESLLRALRSGQGLDLHPSNFALDGDLLVYLDDDVTPAPPVPGAAHAILQRAEEFADHPAAVERYAAGLIEQLSARLTADDIARLQLVDELRTTRPRAAAARTLRTRLLGVLDPSVVLAEPDLPPIPAVASLAAWRVDEAWEPAESLPAAVGTGPIARVSTHELEADDGEPPAIALSPPEADAGSAAVDPAAVEAAPIDPAAAEPAAVEAPIAGEPLVESWPSPPTGAAQLPSGFIWPVVAGRELVRQIFLRTPTRRDGLPFTYELGDYLLSTSSRHRFVEVDDARAELLRLARAHVARGAAKPGVVLVLAPDDTRGGHWIWTIAPIDGEASAAL